MSKDYTSLLSPSMRDKPRFLSLVTAVLSQADDLFALYETLLPAACSLSTAEGFQLDTLGALAGVPRPAASASDEDYRAYLSAVLALRRWPGTNESLPSVLSAAFPDREVRLLDNLNGTVTASVSGDEPFTQSALLPVPAGIRLTNL